MREPVMPIVSSRSHEAKPPEFPWIGGAACLDFCNTLAGRRKEHPREMLTTYARLVVWAQQAGLVSETEGRQLEHEATRRPGAAGRVLERARALRETICRIFSAAAARDPAASDDLCVFNEAMSEA